MLSNDIHRLDDHKTAMIVHSNSPNPGALGPGTARNSEMSVSGNSQSSTSLYIVSYRQKKLPAPLPGRGECPGKGSPDKGSLSVYISSLPSTADL